MGDKIVVGPINKGLKTDRTAFVIDNDSFPMLLNAYQWRGRVKRKRGTTMLGRLTRFFNSTSTAYSPMATFALVAGAGNLLTGFSLQSNGSIVPGSVTITDTNSGNVYTDNSLGVLTGVPAGSGTINYASGAITITGGGTHPISAVFNYYPDLPVLGLEDWVVTSSAYPSTIAFDQKYSYLISSSFPYPIHDISFYKNPAAVASLPLYVPKAVPTATSWNGQDYRQFWTTNYAGALWATNAVEVPFSSAATTIGMQFKPIQNIVGGAFNVNPTWSQFTITINGHGLVVGDFIFINEVVTLIELNGQTGYVTTVVDANNIIATFPKLFSSAAYGGGGIAQYLTNRSNPNVDSLRWFDGDPTDGGNPPTFIQSNGWVNLPRL